MIYREKHKPKHKYDWLAYLTCVVSSLWALFNAILDYDSFVAIHYPSDTVEKGNFFAGLDMLGGKILVFTVISFCLIVSVFGTILSWQKRKW
jgi:hypothetical protein